MADDEVLRRIDELMAENRSFLRELLLRHEKATNTLVRRMDAGTRALEANTRRVEEGTRQIEENTRAIEAQRVGHTRAMDAQRREFVAESRAQRAALFRMLDRLDGGADPAGA